MDLEDEVHSIWVIYMNKQPSIPLKDKTPEGQHHGIEEIILKDNYYYVGVGDIGDERHSGRDESKNLK